MALGQGFESVLEAAKLASDWAWAAIYREIAGSVTGFLRARGVDDPQDAAGDVFFEVARSIDRFKGDEEDFRTMVFVFAHQRMVEDRHSDRPPRSLLADRVLDRIKRDVALTEDEVQSEVSDDVRRAFEVLTQEQRDVISLRVVGGLSLEQTAEVISRGTDAVKSLQRKALAKIRRAVPAGMVMP